jgi:hypothetical protein
LLFVWRKEIIKYWGISPADVNINRWNSLAPTTGITVTPAEELVSVKKILPCGAVSSIAGVFYRKTPSTPSITSVFVVPERCIRVSGSLEVATNCPGVAFVL